MTRKILAIEPRAEKQTGAGLRVDGLLHRLQGPFEVERSGIEEFYRGLTPRPATPERWRFLARRPGWAPAYEPADREVIRERLRRRLRESRADLLWVGHGSTAAALDLGEFDADVPTVVDAYDLLWTALERRLVAGRPSRRRWVRAKLEVERARRFEHRLYGQADQVWVCSDLDRRRLLKDLPAGAVRVVPNFFTPQDVPRVVGPGSVGDRPVLFVGTMGYYPNRQGMEWFLQNVWSRITAERPRARLWVVGPWPDWAEPAACYRQSGVEIKGFVDDLDAVWAQASILVCPLLVGSGTRIKILEAWSRKVPVVSTGVGIEGLGAEDGVHARICDDPEATAEAVLGLMTDAPAHRRIAEGGHRLWQERYTLDKVAEAAVEGCRDLLDA